MILILSVLGVLGLLGLTVLCPVLAGALYLFQSKSREQAKSQDICVIEIVIPAHNEEGAILATLESIRKSIAGARSSGVQSSVLVHVVADGCTDKTTDKVRSLSDVKLTEFNPNRGKWSVLKAVVSTSTADWIFFVDAGTLWPESLLKDVLTKVTSRVISVAPLYRPLNAGLLHRLVWDVEVALKRLEQLAGGPVSVHGSTVAYRATALKEGFDRLGDEHWLNDDVVIPMTLRAHDKSGIIVYGAGSVSDAGFKSRQVDIARRKRMTIGNLQWVRAILPQAFRLNGVVGILALRRMFRLLWAYWGLFWLAALTLVWPVAGLFCLVAALVLGCFSGSFRQLFGAALVSWAVPGLLFSGRARREVRWK